MFFSPVLSVVSMLCFQLLCIVWPSSWSLSNTWSCVSGEMFSQVTSASLPCVTPRSVGRTPRYPAQGGASDGDGPGAPGDPARPARAAVPAQTWAGGSEPPGPASRDTKPSGQMTLLAGGLTGTQLNFPSKIAV